MTAKSPYLLGNRHRANAAVPIGAARREDAHLFALHDQVVAAHDPVDLDKALVAPLRDRDLHQQGVAILDCLEEGAMGVDQRGAEDASVFSVSCQGGTPQLTKKWREAASIQRKKLGNQTMPAGSQSPNSTWTL